MNSLFRLTSLAATVAALALTAAPAQAATPTPPAQAKVKIVKAVSIARVFDLEFGTVVLSGPAGFTGAVVSVSSAGVRTCGANLTCATSTVTAGEYKVTGSQGQTVNLTVPASVVIQNAALDSLTVNITGAPASLVLTNSGATGDNFTFGGSISLDHATPDGDYSGDVVITANYPA